METKPLFQNRLFLTITAFKLVLLALFSSGYKDLLFVPFVDYFVSTWNNPWQYYYENELPSSFPYPALMLYILSPFQFLSNLFKHFVLQNFLFKLPLLASDIIILFFLLKMYPYRPRSIIAFYFASPIIIYSCYIHSQLDLIPTAFLIVALFFLLRGKLVLSSLIFGMAISVKFHVAAAFPLILVYLWKRYGFTIRTLCYFLVPPVVYMLFSLPFLFSEGFFHLVLRNKEQLQIFDVTFPVSNLQIYLSITVVLLIYMRFLLYHKINNDLLFSYTGLLFAAFLVFVPPMPGWYVWIIPFLIIYFINAYQTNNERIFILDAILSVSYLGYFIFFHPSSYYDVSILGHILDLKLDSNLTANLAFTILTACLLTVIYYLYLYGVRSNSIYKKGQLAFVIGIGGDSGTGKSTLLQDIRKLLNQRRILEIEGDGDHKWERGDENWKSFTHLNPKANYLHRQSEHLMMLKRGLTVERVIYDHDTGKFTKPIKTKSNDFIVLSGLHPFYLPKMRKNIDLKIYLETDESLRRHWKILRDTKKRGYTKEQVLHQIAARYPDAQKYIHPQRNYADLVIAYFSERPIREGDETENPEIYVKFTIDSNVDLEPLIIELVKAGIQDYEHNYSVDLKTQYLIVRKISDNLDCRLIANRIITNTEELITEDVEFLPGIRGIVQVIILIMIAEKMKEDILEN
jgi:uridine kinase